MTPMITEGELTLFSVKILSQTNVDMTINKPFIG